MDIISPHIGLIFWQTIVLVLAYVVLKKFAWKHILAYIDQEEEKHAQSIKAEASARKTAERLQLMSDSMLEKAELKKQKIIQKAQATQKALIAEAKLRGEKAYEDMLVKARLEIKKKEKEALEAFKKQASSLVVSTAQKVLQRQLETQHIQQAVLNKLLQEAKIEKAQ